MFTDQLKIPAAVRPPLSLANGKGVRFRSLNVKWDEPRTSGLGVGALWAIAGRKWG